MLKAALNRGFYADRVSSDTAWRKVKPFKRVDEAVVRYLNADAMSYFTIPLTNAPSEIRA
jgi:hypothetical protein